MSEENDGQQAGGQADEFEAITSQDQLDKVLGKRLERERSRFADYDDLKSKAAKFDEAEAKNKTELERAQEQIKQLENRAVESERSALRTRVAAEMNVPVEVLQGEDEETVRASAQKIIDWRDSNKKTPPEPKRLKSGASGSADDGQGRAAAALRTLRGAH